MGLFDIFKPKDELLESKITYLENKISSLQNEYDEKVNKRETDLKNMLSSKQSELDSLKKQISLANDELDIQDFGFYNRQYKFTDSQQYKNTLIRIRDAEKSAVKDGIAGIIVSPMTLNNSLSKGKAMQNQLIKAAIRGFNGESDALLTKISVSNVDKKVMALEKAAKQLNRMYAHNQIQISDHYVDLKRQELYALMLDLRTDFSLPCKLIAEEHFLYDSIFTRI